MEPNGSSSAQNIAKLWSKNQELDKELKAILKKKSPFDKGAIAIRTNIKDNFVAILFADYDFALSKDVEQNLWKTVFYKVIEEYRKRIRKNVQVAKKAPSEELTKLCDSFYSFLQSGTKFYQDLIIKLQHKYELTVDGSVDFYADSSIHKSYLSCHRCYIFLGDLARYQRDLHHHKGKQDWTKAAVFYRRALRLVPDNGNPHNQLAVLATYADDELGSAYHYFLSLAVSHPFPTARDNLVVLFDKNKAKYAALNGTESAETKDSVDSEPAKGNSTKTSPLKSFLIRFVRLHGIIFTKTGLDAVEELQKQILTELDELLVSELSDDTILEMMIINIFSVFNSSQTTEGQVSYLEATQKNSIVKIATNFSLEFFAHIATSGYSSLGLRHLMPISVFTDYITHHPHLIRDLNGKQVGSITSQDSSVSPQVWIPIWKAMIPLLNQIVSVGSPDAAADSITLPEEIELRGFLPLQSYRHLRYPSEADLEKAEKEVGTNAPENEMRNTKRKNKILSFALTTSILHVQRGPTNIPIRFSLRPGDATASSVPRLTEAELAGSEVMPIDDQTLQNVHMQGSQDAEDSFMTYGAQNVPNEEDSDDEEEPDDEVILFKPGQGTKLNPTEHAESGQKSAIGSGRVDRADPKREEMETTVPSPQTSFDLFGGNQGGNNSLFSSFHSSLPQRAFSPPPSISPPMASSPLQSPKVSLASMSPTAMSQSPMQYSDVMTPSPFSRPPQHPSTMFQSPFNTSLTDSYANQTGVSARPKSPPNAQQRSPFSPVAVNMQQTRGNQSYWPQSNGVNAPSNPQMNDVGMSNNMNGVQPPPGFDSRAFFASAAKIGDVVGNIPTVGGQQTSFARNMPYPSFNNGVAPSPAPVAPNMSPMSYIPSPGYNPSPFVPNMPSNPPLSLQSNTPPSAFPGFPVYGQSAIPNTNATAMSWLSQVPSHPSPISAESYGQYGNAYPYSFNGSAPTPSGSLMGPQQTFPFPGAMPSNANLQKTRNPFVNN